MKFCDNCDNMYYISINEEDPNKLTYYCRNCGNVDKTLASENICVLNTQLKKGEQKYNHIINEYTKMDPTLIYIRYDEENMKYLYMCTTCDSVWKTDDKN
jgi:DNA-directed RNA polymerase subunit M/transcription elongation factor TFIIS